jgi:hypothetical protein
MGARARSHSGLGSGRRGARSIWTNVSGAAESTVGELAIHAYFSEVVCDGQSCGPWRSRVVMAHTSMQSDEGMG